MVRPRLLSFKFAFTGIKTALKDEPNLKFHFAAALITALLGWIFEISSTKWLFLILTIGFVISAELTNTAIEEIVNSFTDTVHPSAKKAKDVAAGAVLISAITAAIIGLVIFLPYFYQMSVK